jgi:hypothetical protein
VFEGDRLLEGSTVFISASRPSRDEKFFRVASEAEMEEGVRSLARAVFAEGGHLAVGAHPSISPLIVDVATEYFDARWEGNAPGVADDPPVTVYQSNAFQDVIPPATRALENLGYANILWTDARNGEKYDTSIKDREQCLESLAHMRFRLFSETRPIALVAAGGMQGVIRETRMFLEMFTGNVYVLTSSGGASEKLADYLEINFLQENKPIVAREWRQRLIPVEARFGVAGWKSLLADRTELPGQPWALLMQKVVRHIAGKAEE